MSELVGPLGRKLAWRGRRCRHGDAAVKVFLEETDPKEKAELLRHIFSCPECGRAFEAVRTVWMRSEELLEPILSNGPPAADATARLRNLARSEIKSLKVSRRASGRSASNLRYVLGGAAAVFLIVLTALFLRSRFPRYVFQERTTADTGFVLFQPWNLTAQRPVVFSWKNLSQADHYDLEILDLGLETVYSQRGITSPSHSLPEEVYLRLQKGRTYFWRVTAYLRGGPFLESEFGKFVLPGL